MSAEHKIRRLEERLLDPRVRRTPEEVSALLADGFVEIGRSGRLYSRQEIMAALLEETPISRSIEDFSARELAPTVALATYRVIRQGPEGEPSQSRRSSIWRQTHRGWQMIFHQGTPLNSSP
ncbi:MAG: DUF4440 domain-containing protein [Kiloniellales bacterium]